MRRSNEHKKKAEIDALDPGERSLMRICAYMYSLYTDPEGGSSLQVVSTRGVPCTLVRRRWDGLGTTVAIINNYTEAYVPWTNADTQHRIATSTCSKRVKGANNLTSKNRKT